MRLITNPAFRFASAVLGSFFRGGLRCPGGHRPPSGHVVPRNFVGVGVAAAEDPASDDYILARLREAGIVHVRLDFTYGDLQRPATRLLEKLCAGGFEVMLHLVQPAAVARDMASPVAKVAWQDFLIEVLDRFGGRIAGVEIGSTVNRKRWAGYSLDGFLSMWEIAWHEVRTRGILLAGPSITDFEPPWNIGLLSLLAERRQLPDVHTDNLFSERCTEPERYDHKIFGASMAPFAKVNLVKKARMLQKIGANFGVPKLLSPAAFWTLPRIERLLPDSEEKQADYLARYMVLCAASGALQGAWWGPLICHREGLIDDGDEQYPALERITHYASVNGRVADFRVRPAFHALRTFASMIPGSHYEGRLSVSPLLEVHAFRSNEHLTHVAWTINGRAAALVDSYEDADLQSAAFISRDGDVLSESPSLISESPIYLRWAFERNVVIKPEADILPDLAIHRHVAGKQHFFFREGGWQGVLLARDANEAAVLLQRIHPQRIGAPSEKSTLRHARNAIWTIDDPRTQGARLVVKQPVKMHLHKKLLDRFKPSKGLRSWNGTCELLRRGIAAAPPVAFFEKIGDKSLTRNFYVCEFVPAEASAREMVSAYARGEKKFLGVEQVDACRQLSHYLFSMHARGIHFRDLSGGNILIRKENEGALQFVLIDTGRIHVHSRPLSLAKRLSDLVRVCNKMHAEGRDRFMDMYLQNLGRRFAGRLKLPFYLYDLKVRLKRAAGRKAIKKGWRKISL